MHRRVGEWLLEVAPDRGVETAELAAYHYVEALTYGETSPEVSRRASELLATAGEAALQRASYDVARRQLERAAELATDDDTLAVAGLLLGRLEATVGEPNAAFSHLDRALSLARPEDASLRGEALGWQSRVLWLSGRWEEALAVAQAAVETLSGLPDSPPYARALARRSQLAMLRSDPDALRLAREALATAERVGDAFASVNSRINIESIVAMTRHGRPMPTRSFASSTTRWRSAQPRRHTARSQTSCGTRPGSCRSTRSSGSRRPQPRSSPDLPRPPAIGLYVELSVAMMQLLPAGRWDEIDRMLAGVDSSRLLATARLVWLGLTAHLAVRRGDLDTAEERLGELPLMALESSEPQRIIPMANAFVPWAHLAGREDELRRVVDDTIEAVRGRWSAVITVLPLIRTLHAAGEGELLDRLAASMAPAAEAAQGGRMGTSHVAAQRLDRAARRRCAAGRRAARARGRRRASVRLRVRRGHARARSGGRSRGER